MIVPSFLSLGRIHLPLYGLFAAAGVVCAMLLGQSTARLAAIDADDLWNTGVVAVLSAFVFSRALLVLDNLRTFFAYPLLVLELPSITQGGLYLTALMVFLYIRRRNLPLLGLLDASAPCAALLWAAMYFGDLAGGERAGMPTRVPWAIQSSFSWVHPVEIYCGLGALVVCAVSLVQLRRPHRAGLPSASALLLGGLLQILLDFFRLPAELFSTAPLDGVQWRGAEWAIAGTLLLAWLLRPASGQPAAVRAPHEGVGNAL